MKMKTLEDQLFKFHEEYAKPGVVLFGIKYAAELKTCAIDNIVENTFSKKRQLNGKPYGKDTYKSEVRIGIKLAEHVKLTSEI